MLSLPSVSCSSESSNKSGSTEPRDRIRQAIFNFSLILKPSGIPLSRAGEEHYGSCEIGTWFFIFKNSSKNYFQNNFSESVLAMQILALLVQDMNSVRVFIWIFSSKFNLKKMTLFRFNFSKIFRVSVWIRSQRTAPRLLLSAIRCSTTFTNSASSIWRPSSSTGPRFRLVWYFIL